MDLIEELALALLDLVRDIAHGGGDIGEETRLLRIVEQVEQRARLAEIAERTPVTLTLKQGIAIAGTHGKSTTTAMITDSANTSDAWFSR